jgi:uncharacterized membrane protein
METKLRTFLRILSWRITATLVTAIFTGLKTAVIVHLVLTAMHYYHERIWLKVKWNRY